MILGTWQSDPQYLPVATEERFFFKANGKVLAERLVRLFNKSLKPRLEEDGPDFCWGQHPST